MRLEVPWRELGVEETHAHSFSTRRINSVRRQLLLSYFNGKVHAEGVGGDFSMLYLS